MKETARFVIWVCSKFTREEIESWRAKLVPTVIVTASLPIS